MKPTFAQDELVMVDHRMNDVWVQGKVLHVHIDRDGSEWYDIACIIGCVDGCDLFDLNQVRAFMNESEIDEMVAI